MIKIKRKASKMIKIYFLLLLFLFFPGINQSVFSKGIAEYDPFSDIIEDNEYQDDNYYDDYNNYNDYYPGMQSYENTTFGVLAQYAISDDDWEFMIDGSPNGLGWCDYCSTYAVPRGTGICTTSNCGHDYSSGSGSTGSETQI